MIQRENYKDFERRKNPPCGPRNYSARGKDTQLPSSLVGTEYEFKQLPKGGNKVRGVRGGVQTKR